MGNLSSDTVASRYASELLLLHKTHSGSVEYLVHELLAKLQPSLEKSRKAYKLKLYPSLAAAHAAVVWDTLLKPYFFKGNDAFQPDDTYKKQFISALASEGVDIVIYNRLQQSRVDETTVDTRVTMGGLEFLTFWGVRTKVAQSLGLDLRIIVVDESSAIPLDDMLGFTIPHREESEKILKAYLRKNHLEKHLILRRIIDGFVVSHQDSRTALSLYHEIATQYQQNKADLLHQIQSMHLSPETRRALVFGRALTLAGRQHLGVTKDIRNIQDLSRASTAAQDYLAGVAAAFDTVLRMRTECKKIVVEQKLAGYPEYYQPGRLLSHMGVTRSLHRPGLAPIGKKWNGQHVMVGHSLPLYKNKGYCEGLVPYQLRHNFKILTADNLAVGLLA